ncbi:hypothetical protein JG688_00016724 [Phytophthora aleatoria]|uniref:Uncharacterized protein n=1 Tax=Phytophthora aleatoria TaxID=2496075 RepID=A0A8J5IF68_9STRA|nr:hypothetical protein JG688_00016724 [Phytophthora aleatoria]
MMLLCDRQLSTTAVELIEPSILEGVEGEKFVFIFGGLADVFDWVSPHERVVPAPNNVHLWLLPLPRQHRRLYPAQRSLNRNDDGQRKNSKAQALNGVFGEICYTPSKLIYHDCPLTDMQ